LHEIGQKNTQTTGHFEEDEALWQMCPAKKKKTVHSTPVGSALAAKESNESDRQYGKCDE
jgi:hypothetical protein